MNIIKVPESEKDKIAIVVVGYNRIIPLKRLLNSLLRAKYGQVSVPLYISIDCSHDEELYDYVQCFQWPFGHKYVAIQDERLGLKNHILQCGDLTEQFKALILLEDDVFVGEYFYDYVTHVVAAYEGDDRIGGFALYTHELAGTGIPVSYMNDGSDTFLRQDVVSWGECWTKNQWMLFKAWLNGFDDSDFKRIDMPEQTKRFKHSWTKYYAAYLVDTNRYFVIPYHSYTTCFCDAGEHYSLKTMAGQVCLVAGSRDYIFHPFEKMVRYDIYFVNERIYDWLGFDKSEICVDWYNLRKKSEGKRYLLSAMKLPFSIIKKYGLYLRPIELNVKYNIDGDGLYIYDVSGINNLNKATFTIGFANYCVRSLNINMLCLYLRSLYRKRILKRIMKLF